MISSKHFKKEIPVVACWAYYYLKVSGRFEVLPRLIGTDEIISKHIIYKSKRKPSKSKKHLLTFYSLGLNIVIWMKFVFRVLIYPIETYVVGGINFFKDSVWMDGVRFFNWTNFVIMLLMFFYILYLTI